MRDGGFDTVTKIKNGNIKWKKDQPLIKQENIKEFHFDSSD